MTQAERIFKKLQELKNEISKQDKEQIAQELFISLFTVNKYLNIKCANPTTGASILTKVKLIIKERESLLNEKH